ncbi:uncharacterized protein [Euwallacea fornicatus]|uniref:uncharacterized protein isoform X2 n=1 Tax=Euwallacea fornicatus TaxID=995702 RepID=UPI00338FA273
MLEGRRKGVDRTVKRNKASSAKNSLNKGGLQPPNEDNIMTRKPIRTRRPRIPILQSGYCAICNLPYNNIEDHVQSKKHQKLIGEDANYIALNGYIQDVGIESLLSLTGIDAIGLDDFSPKVKRSMPRTRASSVVSEIVNPAQIVENDTGHRLRSRKNINYMTPPLDDDSFQEKPDMEPVRLQYTEYRELRSSTRALARLTSCLPTKDGNATDVWDSGRPKRACINRQKRFSADERLVADNKTYYKVEVLSSKLRSSDKEVAKPKESKPNESEKGLIVKFKKMRNSELVQLNNEATNFLFPKKIDSSDEEDERDLNDTRVKLENGSSIAEVTETTDMGNESQLEKPDDEASLDSISSDCKTKKKRRSHAEAFILDNQKYYKFETPGSRLRYHGSYLSPVPSKSNGDILKTEVKEEPREESKEDTGDRLKVNLDDFKFSFESVPENEKWYKTFRRQDRAEQRYYFTNNYHWNDFVLPHQIPHLRAIDPRICYNAYKNLKQCICEAATTTKTLGTCKDVDSCGVEASEELEKPVLVDQSEDDSRESEMSSTSAVDESGASTRSNSRTVTETLTLSPTTSRARNARKSPRQHASTLAILSSLVQQRRKRSGNAVESNVNSLPTIQEEPLPSVSKKKKPVTPQKQRKPKVDYFAIAAEIDEELNTALDFDVDLEPTTDPDISFLDSRVSLSDLIEVHDSKTKEENNCQKSLNLTACKKPIKRKKNLTGWPNKIKKKKVVKEERANGDNASEAEGESGSINGRKNGQTEIDDRENKCDQDIENRVGNDTSEIRDSLLQPFVYVKKLDNCEKLGVRKLIIKSPTKRTIRKVHRRILSSRPKKSPRMLRRATGGRWIRER